MRPPEVRTWRGRRWPPPGPAPPPDARRPAGTRWARAAGRAIFGDGGGPGSGPDARDPQPLGATLRTWVASAGAGADLKKATLFAKWAEIVGAEVADHCAPVSLVDGELVLQAESTAWATQIRMLAPQLLRRINAEVGDRSVLRIRARGPVGPSWKFGYRHVSGRGPRDTYG